MSRIPSFAIVLEGGLVQTVIVQDWPGQVPLPRIAVIDYDTEGAADDEITQFAIGDKPAEAICRGDVPEVYESLPVALSPRAVLAALGEPVDDDASEPAMTVARNVRNSIVALDEALNRKEQAPTGSDYNELYVLANCGLIDVLKAMGDTTDFGD